MKPSRLLFALAAILVLAVPAAAQRPDSANAALWLRGVCPGTREVRIETMDGDRVRGYCGPIENAQLRVKLGRDEQVVPFRDVESIWVRQRASGEGATVGALIGALAVGGAGAFLASSLCEFESDCMDGVVLFGLGGAAVGGTAGALLGAVLGSTTRSWRRIYP
ncbi:MAG TPA: hypothetical protein VHG93_28280 [Longimicrobium sp.]|nr:hypothetical protein [Longimicrobium sp.]